MRIAAPLWLLTLAACSTSDRLAFLRDGKAWVLDVDSGRETLSNNPAILKMLQPPPGSNPGLLTLEQRAKDVPEEEDLGRPSPDGRRRAKIVDKKIVVDGTEVLKTSLTILSLSWSPDSQRLAVVLAEPHPPDPTITEPFGLRVIWAGGGMSELVFGGYSLEAVWSPDGRRLAFAGRRGDRKGIWAASIDGELLFLAETHVLSHGIALGTPAWSPDSKRIAYVSTRKENEFPYRICTVEVDGGLRTELKGSEGHDLEPCWSPSGRRLLFVRAEGYGSEKPEIWMMDADGGKARRLMKIAPAFWLP